MQTRSAYRAAARSLASKFPSASLAAVSDADRLSPEVPTIKCLECRCCDATPQTEATEEPLCHECAEAIPCRRGIRSTEIIKAQVKLSRRVQLYAPASSESVPEELVLAQQSDAHVRRDEFPAEFPKAMRIIFAAVSKQLDIPVFTILARKRTPDIVLARQMAAWLAYRLTGMSTMQVGRYLSLHHTTILHSIAKISALEGTAEPTARILAHVQQVVQPQLDRLGPASHSVTAAQANTWWLTLGAADRVRLHRLYSHVMVERSQA